MPILKLSAPETIHFLHYRFIILSLLHCLSCVCQLFIKDHDDDDDDDAIISGH